MGDMQPSARNSTIEGQDMEKAGFDGDESGTLSNPPIEPFPEGGLRAWLTVLGVWLVQFSTFGYTNSYGVFNDYYVRVFMADKYTSSQMSWVGSMQLMLVMSAGLVSGRLYDIGYFYHLMIGGGLLFVFSLFMLSLVQPGQYYQVFLSQGVGAGAAIGIMYIPGMAVVAQYFKKRRILVMGIVTSGSGLGGAIQPIMLNKLLHGSVGFGNAVRASAGFNLGLLVIAGLLTRTRASASGQTMAKRNGSLLKHLRGFFREPEYTLTVIGTFFVLVALYFPIFFLQLNAVKRGVDEDLAFYVLTVLNGSTVIGRLLGTAFVNQIGVMNIVIPCVLICAILIFCLLVVKNVATTFTFGVLYGIFCGAYTGILAPMLGSLAKNESEIGARMGICFAFTGIGGLIGTPIAGALLTSSYMWWRPIVFAGACMTAGGISFACARHLIAVQKHTQRV